MLDMTMGDILFSMCIVLILFWLSVNTITYKNENERLKQLKSKETVKETPKTKSVLQDWVNTVTLKEQTTLLSVIRGNDTECVSAKNITKMLRHIILIDADKKTSFMSDTVIPAGKVINYLKQTYVSNNHWVEHVVYAAFVISKHNPNNYAAKYWLTVGGSVNGYIKELKRKEKDIQKIIDKYETIYNKGYC